MRAMRRLTLVVLWLFASLPVMAQQPLTATLTDAVTGLPSTGNFLFTVGGPNPHNQILTWTNSGTFTITGLSVQLVQGAVPPGGSANWLNLSAFGTSSLVAGQTTTATLSLNPAVLTAGVLGDYFGTVIVTADNSTPSTVSIPVRLMLTGVSLVTLQPGVLSLFSYTQGCQNTVPGAGCDPAPQNLSVNMTGLLQGEPSQLTITANSTGNWLQILTPSNAAPTFPVPIGTSPINFHAAVNPAVLNTLAASNVPYQGTLTLDIPGMPNSPMVLNVAVLVQSGPAFTLTGATLLANNTLRYDFTLGNNLQPLVQTLNVGAVNAPGGLSYTTSITTICPATIPVPCSTLKWVGGSPAAGTTPQAFAVTVFPSVVSVGALPCLDTRYAGDYTATITIYNAVPNPMAADVVITATFHVNPTLGFPVSPSIVSFTLINGVTGVVTSAPSQAINIGGCTPGPGIGFQATLLIDTPSGGSWATLANSAGTTDANGRGTVTVQLNPPAPPNFLTATAGVPYSANIAIQFNNSFPPIQVPVLLQVVGQPLQVMTPGSFAFPNHTIGVTTPGTMAASLTTAAVPVPSPLVATPLAFTATAAVSPNEKCGSSWLAVSPTTGTTTGNSTPTPLTVSYFSLNSIDDQTDYTCHGNIIVSTPGAAVPVIAYPVTMNVLRRPSLITNLTPPASLTGAIDQFHNPVNVSFTVSATGGNALAITSATAATIPANQGWLSIAPNSGTTPQTFTVTMTPGTLSPGTYDGNIIIVAQAANSPLTIPVTCCFGPPHCNFTVSTPTVNLGNGSGTFTSLAGSFTVIPNGVGCSTLDTWTAARGADSLGRGLYWVTSISPTSGNGSAPATVNFTAFTTTTTAVRTGVINIQSADLPTALAFTITQAGSTESQLQREVRSLYQTILGREPDQGGFDFWTGPGAGALYQLADDFYTSNEFLQTGYMAGAIYQAVLGRVSTQTEWNAASAILRPADTSVAAIQAAQEQIVDQLLASGEYGGGPGPKAAAPCTLPCGTPTDFLTRLYQTALGRMPDPDGYAYWYNLLSNGTLTPSEVVLFFINSPEFQSRTNPLYITLLYYTILLRTPDSGGLSFWTGVANSGGNGIPFLTTPAAINTRYVILGPNYQGSQGFLGSLTIACYAPFGNFQCPLQ